MGETWDCCSRGMSDPEPPWGMLKNTMHEARKGCAKSPETMKELECMKWGNRCTRSSGTEMYPSKRGIHVRPFKPKHELVFSFRKSEKSVRPSSSLVIADGRRKMHNVFRDGWVTCPRVHLWQLICTIMPYRFKQKPNRNLSKVLPIFIL